MRVALKNFLTALILLQICFLFAKMESFGAEDESANRRTIICGCDNNYPPYEYVNDLGEITGYNIDIVRAIAKVMGFNLEIRPGPWAETRKKLENGELDMLASMFYSEGRDKTADFSMPHIMITHAVFTRNNSFIHTLSDLNSRQIIVQEGDIMHDYARHNFPNAEIITVENQAAALTLLSSGKYDCALLGYLQAMYNLKQLGLDNIIFLGERLSPQKYCIAVKEGDTELLGTINEGLSIIKKAGTYNKIRQKWFGVYEEKTFLEKLYNLLLWVLLPLTLLVFAGFFWSWTLRRAVDEQTKALNMELAERKQMEQRLGESEQRHRRLFESSGDAVFLLNNRGEILNVNKAACHMLGYEKATLLSMSAYDVADESERKKLEEAFSWEPAEGPVHLQLVLKKSDGKTFTSDVNACEVDSESGLIQAIARDISERMHMEEQLRQAEKMQAVGQLAGGIAHDFNNQLTGIIGYSEILQGRLEGKEKTYCEKILKTARRAADLTRQLLEFSRKNTYPKFTVNLHELIEEVVSLLCHTVDKRIRIAKDLNAKNPITVGASSQLENALLNIGLNASQAMAGGGTLTFHTEDFVADTAYCMQSPYEITPGAYTRINIVDTGCGMDEDTIKRIFEPFFTTKKENGGTGMGLAAVYGTIKNHHGTIDVISNPGAGTTFTLLLPVIEGKTSEIRIKGRKKELPKNLNVMIVDDEIVVRELAGDIFTELGYKVNSFESGNDALVFYKEHWQEIDVIFLDMIMPDIGGTDVFRELRKINSQAKVLLSSGYSVKGETQQLLDEGAKFFLKKPFKKEELLSALSLVLQYRE